jgi:AAHS family 4-hydroxybenzoate transporter-like MFS transporter
MNTSNQVSVDVGAVLDGARFLGLPTLVLLCTAVVMVLDGFDIQVIGFAAPALAANFGVERSALAPALAASLVGMAVGSFSLGPWGDRHGRRPALLISTVLFGLATLATAGASNLTALTVLRFVTGVGLGGALPNATALMAEFAPPKARGQAIAAAIVGVPVGGILGAAIAAEVIPAFGWQAIFVVGGALPLAAALIIYFILPESPRYLAAHPGREAELAKILNRILEENRFVGNERFRLAAPATVSVEAPLDVSVFSAGLRRDTFALWAVFVTNLFAVYCFYNWAPTVLTSLGIDLATAVRGSLVFNTTGLIGSLLMSWIIARTGSRWPQVLLGVIAALAMLYIAQLVNDAESSGQLSTVAIMIGFAVGGFGILSLQVTAYAVGSHVYPTICRSAGIGWAAGMGRLGGVLSAFAGAMIMARTGASGFFIAIACILVITVASVLLLRRHIPSAKATRAAADTSVGLSSEKIV